VIYGVIVVFLRIPPSIPISGLMLASGHPPKNFLLTSVTKVFEMVCNSESRLCYPNPTTSLVTFTFDTRFFLHSP
jgi:hypothetical protein